MSEMSTSKLKKHKKRPREVNSNNSDEDDSSGSSHHRKKSKKDGKKKTLKKKKSKKVKKMKYRSGSSDDSDGCNKEKRKKKEKKKLKKRSYEKIGESGSSKTHQTELDVGDVPFGPEVPDDIQNKSKSMVPITKEEWDKQQSHIRRVYDSETGRHRLVRGDGEIIEECVSRDRHRQINKQATAADGLFFQMNVSKK